MNPLKVLFVCALNKWRSPTAEAIYRNDPRLEVRSAGIRSAAKRRLTAEDLESADVVFSMVQEHKTFMVEEFRDLDLPPIIVLEIADNFGYMSAELQEVLRTSIDAELEVFIPKEKSDLDG